ncbi:MAG: chorismate mutase [Candidatus Thermoplasmatota archaeon]|nr:chorismate mutase [Candidatus Thermoplasmatota archaeon]
MVYFIGNRNENADNLEILREKLLNNSRSLLQLFQERLDIARLIGEVKRSREIGLRDRHQEIRVREKLGVSDPIEERFLNLLFELTVMSEEADNQSKRNLVFEESEALQVMIADLLFKPGDMISTRADSGLPIIQRAIRRGVHLVDEDQSIYDLHILISRSPRNSAIKILKPGIENAVLSKQAHRPRIIKLEVSE